jgi:hypothetical protein
MQNTKGSILVCIILKCLSVNSIAEGQKFIAGRPKFSLYQFKKESQTTFFFSKQEGEMFSKKQ